MTKSHWQVNNWNRGENWKIGDSMIRNFPLILKRLCFCLVESQWMSLLCNTNSISIFSTSSRYLAFLLHGKSSPWSKDFPTSKRKTLNDKAAENWLNVQTEYCHLLNHISKLSNQKIILKRKVMVAVGSVFNCTFQSDLAIA